MSVYDLSQYSHLPSLEKRCHNRGFEVLARCWVVVRTFGWLNNYRRLSKDYEELTESSETLIYLAMSHIMLRRLAETNHFER